MLPEAPSANAKGTSDTKVQSPRTPGSDLIS
jgi:hypothetical protein